MNKGRAQCLVIKGNKILMVKHNQCGIEYFCLPGGGIEDGETPEVVIYPNTGKVRIMAGDMHKSFKIESEVNYLDGE